MSLPKWFKYPPFTTHGLALPFSRKQAERLEGTSNNIPLLDLDGVPSAGAATAYGLRRLRAAYTGAALKVRRTIGATTVEADVHFNGDDKVGMDSKITIKSGSYTGVPTLGQFCKAIDGFVSLWYDQSGNSRDLGQSTAAAQPYLVVSGVLQAPEDGLYFDGSARWMKSGFEHESSTDDYTYLCVSRYHTSASGSSLGLMTDLETYNKGVEVNANDDVYGHFIDATDLATTAKVRSNKTDLVIASFDANPASNQQKLRVNGVLSQKTCTENILAADREVFGIGVRRHDAGGNAVQGFWHGYISEVITWETALDEDEATAVTDDITDFFSIELLPESDRFSLDLDGTDDHIAFSEINLGTVYTMSAWFKLPDLNDGQYDIMGGPANHYVFEVRIYNSGANHRWHHGIYEGSTAASVDVDPVGGFTSGWHHYAISRNGTSVTFYIDGVQEGTTQTLPANIDGKVKYLGRYESAYAEGNLDNCAIFDYALSAAQINALRNNNGPADLTPLSPVGWWKMDEGSGTNVIDYGSGGNDGTIVSAPEYTINCPPQFSSTSVSLDGSDDYVDTGFQPDFIHSNATLSFWLNLANFTGDQMMGCHANNRFWAGTSGNNLSFGVANGYKSSTNMTSYMSAGTWHHMCLVCEDGNAYYFVDGVQRDSNTYTQDASRNPNRNFTIGALNDTSAVSNFMEGKVDEVAIFDRALSRFEVAAIYNSAGTPRTLDTYNPTAWWRMGEGSPTGIILDEEGTGSKALHLPGVADNYASVPDAADLDGFTNFTLEAKGVTFANWTPSTVQGLLTKYEDTGNQRSYYFSLTTAGKLELVVSFDGTTPVGYTSSAVTGIANGATADIMVMRNGVDVRFYVNGVQLGTDVTCVTTAVYNSTAVFEVGSVYTGDVYAMSGSIQRARVWNSAVANQATPTETPVLDANFTLADKGASSFTATSGQTVTIHSTAGAAVIKGPTDGSLISGAVTSTDTP